MRIHRIRLQNFAGVEDNEIEPAQSGVTLVKGPNESGKSSFVEALRLIFEHKDRSTHRHIAAVRPVHRDAGPRVEVEMTAGPYRFSYAKQWIKGAATELTVTAPAPEQHTGNEAHDRAGQILAETVDLDLWRALTLQQGDSLDQAALADVGALHRALSHASGGTGGGEHADLMAAIGAEREKYFTPRKDQETGDLARAGQAAAEARERREAARERLAEADDVVADHARVTRELESVRTASTEAVARRDELASRVEQAQSLVAQLAEAQTAQREAALRHETARERLDRRTEQIGRWNELARKHQQARADRDRDAAALQTCVEAVRSAEEERDAVRRKRQAAGEALDEGMRRERVREARREAEALAARLRTVTEASERLSEIEAALAQNRIDEATLSAIEQAHLRAETLAGAARSEAPAVEVERLGEAVVLRDGTPIEGDHTEIEAVAPVRIEVPDAVRVTVRPDAASQQRENTARQAREARDRLLAEHRVENVDEARRRRAARTSLEEDRRAAQTRRESALAAESAEGMQARLAEARALQTELGELEDPAAEEDLDAARAREVDLRRAEAEAERHLARAREDREQANAHAVGSRTRYEAITVQRDEAEALLDRERAGVDDPGLQRAEAAAAAALDEAERALERAAHAHDAAKIAELTESLDLQKALVENAQAAIRDLEKRESSLIGHLNSLGTQGWHDRLGEAESRLAEAERERERLRARAEAARLLDETFTRHRTAARRRYVEPYTREMERLGRVVFGEDFAVTIDDTLTIESRTLGGATVPFASLSGGAREQLVLLGRLAAAVLIDSEEGAPVLIDDSLGFSDAERRRSVGAVLSMVGRGTQIIALTCEPSRYSGVVVARPIDL